ncbi:beta-glucoside-specific PTS transporter subunit IIABC [Desemzia sp. FAM 23991]|uniref:beta-glucoside-specific PTS transporter subunit IIABC n=1 Tax=Desemzia sp. FAM 23991 TaxID=3259521 RepID=UPI003887B027
MSDQILAKSILKNVGGEKNVNSLAHCATRLRFKLKDRKSANKEEIEKMDGVVSVVESGGQFQVVIGNNVSNIYKEIGKISNLTNDMVGESHSSSSNEKFIDRAIDLVSSIFTPILPALIGSGMLKGLLMLCTNYFGLSAESGTYMIMNAASDSVFYFLPVLLAYTSARKFNANLFLSVVVGGSLIYPSLVAAFNEGMALDFLGIPVILTRYTSSVLPVIFAVYVLSKVEYVSNKYIHPVIRNVLTPMIAIGIVVPLTYLLIGPVTNSLSGLIGSGYEFIYNISPIVTGFVLGAAWQVLVVFGLHWGIVPIGYNNLALYGRNTINGMTGPSNFAQAGAALGVALKTKNLKLKQIAFSAAITAIFSITEPAVYGVTLKYKKPFYIACLAGGIGGAIAGVSNSAALAAGPVGILSIPLFFGEGFWGFIIAIAVAFFASAILTYLFGYDRDNDIVEDDRPIKNQKVETIENEVIASPLNGKKINLETVSDETFAKKSLGNGVAIIPSDGKLYAPVDGEISIAFPTGHAIGIISGNGAEILMHIGFNTVELDGKYFKLNVTQGQTVTKGDLLVDFDIEKIKEAGYEVTTPVVITNSALYKVNTEVNSLTDIAIGEELIELEVK